MMKLLRMMQKNTMKPDLIYFNEVPNRFTPLKWPIMKKSFLPENEIIEIRRKVEDGGNFKDLTKAESDDKQNEGHLALEKGRMVLEFEKLYLH